MAQPNPAVKLTHPAADEALLDETPHDLMQLLRQAAQLAAAHGIDSDPFLQAAWLAFLDVSPALRAQLEDKQLLVQLANLRDRGLLAQA